MKKISVFLSLVFLGLSSLSLIAVAKSALVIEDTFDGAAIDSSKWDVAQPFSDSSVVVDGGNVVLNNNGQITPKQQPVAPYTITLEGVQMSQWEVLSIVIRSDGIIPPGEEVAPGIRLNLWNHNSSGGAWFAPTGLQGGELLASGSWNSSSAYDLRITDDGQLFRLYVNNVLVFERSTALSAGSKLTIFNRGTQRGWAIPSSTRIARISISQEAPIDSDNDGVNNYRETKDGTDPNNASSFNPLSKGLVAYYPFDGNANDESGHSNNLVNPTSGVIFARGQTGESNSAIMLSSASDSVSSINPLGIAGNQSHSFSFWLYLPSYPSWSSGDGTLLTLGQGGQRPGCISQMFCDDHPDGGGRLVSHGGYADMELRNLGALFLGKWHHVVCAYSGSVAATCIYIDGVPTTLMPWPGGNLTDSKELASTPLTIGRKPDSGPSAAPGAILSDIRVYDRDLSVAEAYQLYQQEAGNLDTDGDGLTDAWERGCGRYQIIMGNFTWQQAKTDAEAKGGHLGTITSEDEWAAIQQALGAAITGKNMWLGGTDQEQEGQWKWTTGEIWSFTRWILSEPNNSINGGENFVHTFGYEYPDHRWNDLPNAPQQYGFTDGGRGNLHYLLEFGYPTDPFKADTDSDGYNDKVESDAGTDPNNPASKPVPPDTDNDGIPDAYETNTGTYVSATDTGTDPAKADTDGDGLNDGLENNTGVWVSATDTGTDPNNPDSDGDALNDGVETNTGIYVSAGNTGTNPNNSDTSGDGITDGEAVTAQFNPLIDQRPVLNFLTQAVTAQPNRFGFYNESNVMHLGMGGLMIRKSGSVVNLDLQWQTKTSLTNAWTKQGSPIPFFLNLPGNKAFIRLQASPGAQ